MRSSVPQGLFALAERLFDVTIHEARDVDAPVWHPDVGVYQVASPPEPSNANHPEHAS